MGSSVERREVHGVVLWLDVVCYRGVGFRVEGGLSCINAVEHIMALIIVENLIG